MAGHTGCSLQSPIDPGLHRAPSFVHRPLSICSRGLPILLKPTTKEQSTQWKAIGTHHHPRTLVEMPPRESSSHASLVKVIKDAQLFWCISRDIQSEYPTWSFRYLTSIPIHRHILHSSLVSRLQRGYTRRDISRGPLPLLYLVSTTLRLRVTQDPYKVSMVVCCDDPLFA